jgi:hypothetical protein
VSVCQRQVVGLHTAQKLEWMPNKHKSWD